MSNKKFLIIIVFAYLVVTTTVLLLLTPTIKDSFDIILELTFVFQPIIWIFLAKRYFKGQLYSTILSIGFTLFFFGGVLEIIEEKLPASAVLDNLEDLAMVIAIAFITYAILHITKITNRKLLILSEKNKKHYIDSIHDPLTTLYNKRYLHTNFDMIFNNNPSIFHNCVCVFIDIDNFKVFNESQGHEVGDKLLSKLGSIINKYKRKGDFAFRYGGEEFLLFFMNTHQALIYDKLDEIRKLFRAYTKENFYHPKINFTISIGATTYKYGESLTSIIKRADDAMYDSKNSGKDRITTI